MSKMTKEKLLNGLTREEAIAKIEALKKGSFCLVEYKDGAPIKVIDDITIVTTLVIDARFVNYGNTKLAKASEAIRRADSAERFSEATNAMNALNAMEKTCLSKKIREEYAAKTAAYENNRPLWITPKKNVTRNVDENHPYLSTSMDGRVHLAVNIAYRYDLNARKIATPRRKYYLISKDSVGEITSDFAGVLTDVAKEARKLAGKEEAIPSSFYNINISNVCDIYKLGKEG